MRDTILCLCDLTGDTRMRTVQTADHCRSMLGYTGSMPSEVPNQSEDAK